MEFNTVVDNLANLGVTTAGGIECEGTYDAPFNLVYRNQGGLGGAYEVVGTCTFQSSYVNHDMPGENAVEFKNPNDSTNPDFRLSDRSPTGTIRDSFP